MTDFKINSEQIKSAIADRRWLHENPELGFDLPKTTKYIIFYLEKNNINYSIDQDNIISVNFGNKGKTLLLRADMDALPIKEESGLEFSSKNGNMHACGHDFHSAILLNVAKLLKQKEPLLKNKVKLIFQPAEEIIEGGKKVVDNGYLDEVDNAIMLHLYPSLDVKAGTIIIPEPGANTLSTDFFKIEVNGSGGHGAMPEKAIDPIIVASHIIINLMNICEREISFLNPTLITIGKVISGEKSNIIASKAIIEGSIRTFDEQNKPFIYSRIKDISKFTAQTFRATAEAEILKGCQSVVSDKLLIDKIKDLFISENIKFENAINLFNKGKFIFGEDFSYYSAKVPSAIFLVAAGREEDGFKYPLHNPKVLFDESLLANAINALIAIALNY
ncbi:MAG: M20 metallopeptidase family protein [Pleomorphochaeta sp.]